MLIVFAITTVIYATLLVHLASKLAATRKRFRQIEDEIAMATTAMGQFVPMLVQPMV